MVLASKPMARMGCSARLSSAHPFPAALHAPKPLSTFFLTRRRGPIHPIHPIPSHPIPYHPSPAQPISSHAIHPWALKADRPESEAVAPPFGQG